MFYKKLTVDQALITLGDLQMMLEKIKDEPLIEEAMKKIKSAAVDLMKVQDDIINHLEERK